MILRAALACFALLACAIPQMTHAWYDDEEQSTENVFSTGTFDAVLSIQSFEGVLSNVADDESQLDVNLSLLEGSFAGQYTISYEYATGSPAMCASLDMTINDDAVNYDGPLVSLNAGPTETYGLLPLSITVSSGSSLTPGEYCEFDLVFDNWLAGVPNENDSGYTDEERLRVRITAEGVDAPVVLNEFLPNPDGILCVGGGSDCEEGDEDFIFDFGKDSSDQPQGEWVELYNTTGAPIDLAGWYIQDASGGVGNTAVTGANTNTGTTTIAANGYIVVYMNKPVWNNTGDTVKLFNAGDLLQDSYAYTSDYDYCFLEPTQGNENDTIPSGTESCGPGNSVPPNKSYARIPDGFGSFVDPIPTPGGENTLDEKPKFTFLSDVQNDTVESPKPEPTVAGDNVSQGDDNKDVEKGTDDDLGSDDEDTASEGTEDDSDSDSEQKLDEETAGKDEEDIVEKKSNKNDSNDSDEDDETTDEKPKTTDDTESNDSLDTDEDEQETESTQDSADGEEKSEEDIIKTENTDNSAADSDVDTDVSDETESSEEPIAKEDEKIEDNTEDKQETS